MKRIFGLDIPQTLEDVCKPERLALLVYDVQVGILHQLPGEPTMQTVSRIEQVLQTARQAGVRIFFSRHLSLPKEAMGVFQYRQAMAWQRVISPEQVHPWFLRDAPGFQIAPQVAPLPSEVVFDKITMSAFEGTFLNIALRDCGINALAIVGFALEVGIEPTMRHAADLGYIPVLVTDACGGRDVEAQRRALAGLSFAGDALFTDTTAFCNCFAQQE